MALKIYGTQAGMYFFINDHLGTPQKIVNNSGQVVWSAAYLPFGKAQVTTETVANHFRFPGQYYDAESGLHYNRHRYYDPETGRYITADPIGLEGGVNLYSYVLNNPTNRTDVNGLKLELMGDANDKAILLKYLSEIAGTQLTMDVKRCISSKFHNPSQRFSDSEMWLKRIIRSDQRFTIIFGTTLQAAYFDNGSVLIDSAFREPNQNSFYYYTTENLTDFFKGAEVLAHELFGHGLVWLDGGPGSSRKLSAYERAYYEQKAIDIENIIRSILGRPSRSK